MLEHQPRTDENALQTNRLHQQADGIQPASARQDANHGNPAAEAHSVQRLRQGSRPHLNHVIDTDPFSEAKHLPVSIRNFLAVHHIVRPQFLHPGNFLVAARRSDHAGPWIFANWTAKIETPPVPRVKTVSPALRFPNSTSAFQAVTAAQGSVAASSNET